MKFILPFLFCCFLSFGQTLTEKWNQYQNRYEYYNISNQLVGYKTYNSYTQSWEYYEQKPQQQVQYRDENFELWANVALAKQQKYDANKQKIQNAVDDIRNKISKSGYPSEVWASALGTFDGKYVDGINTGKYDLSSDNKTTELINWLYSGMNAVLSESFNEYSITQKSRKDKMNQSLNKIAYLKGGYKANSILEEKYNPYTKKYEQTAVYAGECMLYLSLGTISFFRKDNNGWRYNSWIFRHEDTNFFLISDDHNQMIMVDKNMKFIAFYAEPIGDEYLKRYTYRDLKKDSTIKKPY